MSNETTNSLSPREAPRLPAGAWHALIVAACLPPVITMMLAVLNVPLGCPGRFVYLYSPVPGPRTIAALIALVPASLCGLGVGLLATSTATRRTTGCVLAIAGAAGLCVWVYTAPPAFRNQHIFNSQSPSQDGAFVRESKTITSARDYLTRFPDRARTPPAEMRGTRVISNPPATTLLAYGVRRLIAAWPSLGRWVSAPLEPLISRDERFIAMRSDIEAGLIFQLALTALWALSGCALYAAARTLLTPPVTAAFAMLCLFSPSGLLFTPGKDTAQLLTASLPLWLWLLAWRRGSAIAAALAGLAFVAASLASLVHIWLGAIVLSATLVESQRERRIRAITLRCIVPLTAGALGGILLAWLAGCDWLATLRAAANAQAQITRGPDAMPFYWQSLGAPLFLLFAGAGAGTLAFVANRSQAGPGLRPFGMVLVAGSLIVMLGTVGFTNIETPRLWIPFMPLILLGLLVQTPCLSNREPRVALFLGLLVAAQIASGALQWSRMDMREAENRIASTRFFN